MTTEEKAKAYDEALERIWKELQKYGYTGCDTARQIYRYFPELKESEGERIRKELLEHCKNQAKPYIQTGNKCPQIQSWIAWLEKQGNKDSQVKLPTFTFDDILALQCCMETAKKVQNDKDLYEKLNDLHGRIYDAYYLEKQGEQNPYSGVSFKYNSHTWGMCARDDGVEILMDSELKAFISLDKSFIYPISSQSALEAVKEEKIDNQTCVKSVDDIKPKFKVGDWISNDMCDAHIASIEDGMYYFDEGDGLSIVFVDEHYHLWTIEDAMDGDVLCCESGWTCIFKALNSDNISFSSYCFMDNTGWFCETGSESHALEKAFIKAYNGEIYPATKEQRDILFQKMKKEGYVWDSQEKELRKVEQNPTEWSDEDERNMQNIDSVLFYDRKLPEDTCVKLRNFLKTLKERVQPQYLTITNEELVQAKKEAYNDALDKIEYHSDTPTFNDGWSAAIWYLKKRTTQPQSTWKPSEEQMSSLRSVVNSLPHEQVLFTLYNDLRKLKGE